MSSGLPRLRISGSSRLQLDKSSGTTLQIHDYRGHIFTGQNLPDSLAGFVLDRIALESLLKLKSQGHNISFRKAIFYQTDFTGLPLDNLDLSHAKFFDCKLFSFTNCNLKSAVFNTDCTTAHFKNCLVTNTNFTGARNLTGDKLRQCKDWYEAKYFNHEEIAHQIKNSKSNQKVEPKTYRVSWHKRLFGTHSHAITPNKHLYVSPKQQTDPTQSFVAKVTNQDAPPRSLQSILAEALQAPIAAKGERMYTERLRRERILIGKERLGRI